MARNSMRIIFGNISQNALFVNFFGNKKGSVEKYFPSLKTQICSQLLYSRKWRPAHFFPSLPFAFPSPPKCFAKILNIISFEYSAFPTTRNPIPDLLHSITTSLLRVGVILVPAILCGYTIILVNVYQLAEIAI